MFSEAVKVTGIVLTKLDGTAKGGIVVAVQRQLGVPVKLVGLGEGRTTWRRSMPRRSSTRSSADRRCRDADRVRAAAPLLAEVLAGCRGSVSAHRTACDQRATRRPAA